MFKVHILSCKVHLYHNIIFVYAITTENMIINKNELFKGYNFRH